MDVQYSPNKEKVTPKKKPLTDGLGLHSSEDRKLTRS